MQLEDILFRRRFSVNLYRNLSLPMGEMSFYKDWVNDKNGDPYPILSREGDPCESVQNGTYSVNNAESAEIFRLLGSFFPWNTYEISLKKLKDASVGIRVLGKAGEISVSFDEEGGRVCSSEGEHFFASSVREGAILAVTFRTDGVSLYVDNRCIGDVSLQMMRDYRKEELFTHATVALFVKLKKGGVLETDAVKWYLSGGISHADIKPIRYEDGTPMIENGRVFLTVTSRTEMHMFQSVLSWNPTLYDFRMEGALFYDCGDGIWSSGVAASVIYDRNSRRWLLWMCGFSHTHVLGRAAFDHDPRFGVQVINVRLMEPSENDNLRSFAAFDGDEDPDLLYLDGKWHLTVCRKEPQTGYHYYHFISNDPFDGFRFVDRTPTGEKTGGMFVKTTDGYVFVCGSDFHSRARYDVYPINDFSKHTNLICDFDDGGFRGWGSVMLLPVGSRKRYVWITFDRHNASDFRWSYGNLYVFDSDYIRE